MRFLLPLLLLPLGATAQQLVPVHLSDLPSAMDELSGMVVVDGQVWGVMDSWNPAALYRADPHTGVLSRTVTIRNAVNVDWEALTMDNTYVYVGDIGNNFGVRNDLRVLRFPKALLLDEGVMEVSAETIAYSYADQTVFVPTVDGSNWDCEALLAVGDSLWLFTKNWVDQRTYRYVLPATPGTWQAQRRDTLDTDGLITDAALHPTRGSIVLLGHSMGVEPFLWHLAAFPVGRPFAGNMQRYTLDMPPAQTESVAWGEGDTLLIGQERGGEVPAKLWQVFVDPALGVAATTASAMLRIHPVPASDHLHVSHGLPHARCRLLDAAGRPVQVDVLEDGGRMDLSKAAAGVHVLEVEHPQGTLRQRLIVVH